MKKNKQVERVLQFISDNDLTATYVENEFPVIFGRILIRKTVLQELFGEWCPNKIKLVITKP
jgi:hypothetical protein